MPPMIITDRRTGSNNWNRIVTRKNWKQWKLERGEKRAINKIECGVKTAGSVALKPTILKAESCTVTLFQFCSRFGVLAFIRVRIAFTQYPISRFYTYIGIKVLCTARIYWLNAYIRTYCSLLWQGLRCLAWVSPIQ